MDQFFNSLALNSNLAPTNSVAKLVSAAASELDMRKCGSLPVKLRHRDRLAGRTPEGDHECIDDYAKLARPPSKR